MLLNYLNYHSHFHLSKIVQRPSGFEKESSKNKQIQESTDFVVVWVYMVEEIWSSQRKPAIKIDHLQDNTGI